MLTICNVFKNVQLKFNLMKSKKIHFISAIFLFAFNTLIAQNPIWSLPQGQYSEIGGYLPLPTPNVPTNPNYVYANQIPYYTHNAMTDAGGNLQFFMVDNWGYDKNGMGLIRMNFSDPDDLNSNNVRGNSEVCIVPDPGNCSRYYIFTSTFHITSGYNTAVYTLLDMSKQYTLIDESNWPQGIEVSGGPIHGNHMTNNCVPLSTLNWALEDGSSVGHGMYTSARYAATKLRSDNSRLVFVTWQHRIFKFRIDESGITFQPQTLHIPTITGIPQLSITNERTELEVFEMANGHYRLAFDGALADTKVLVSLELNATGAFVPGSVLTHNLAPQGESNQAYIKGLEFSTQGNYLYFTHHTNSNHPNAIEYMDISNGQVSSLVVPNSNNYQYSQIELGADGQLFFAYSGGLSTLQDSEDPTSNWTAAAIPFSYSVTHAGWPNQPRYHSYLLPDQIDGMNYFAHFNTPECCLQFPTTDKIEYVAEESTIWTETSNPLNNGTGSVAYIREELRIPAGITVTIQGMRVEFFEDAKCIIEPGGHLILDNTVFTAGPCENIMWLGVEVWGNPNIPQYPASNQGVLQLKNNSVIEHARIAALMARRVENQWGGFYHDMRGGFVLAYNSVFRNNEKDAVIREYANNQLTISNRCKFTNCTFITDGPLNYAELNPQYHAELYKVYDVQFLNCSFLNTGSFEDYAVANRGTGIWSAWSTFRVKGENNPFLGDLEQAHQSFFLLNQGVLSVGDETSYFSITGMEFQDNQVGLAVSGSCRQMITYNNFYVPAGDNPDYNPSPMGSYFLNSYLFTLEENSYEGASNEALNYGAIAWNTSRFGLAQNQHYYDGQTPVENEFYRNQFTTLHNGIAVVGFNAAVSGSYGLQTRCNEFSDCITDINLLPGSEWRGTQGNSASPELYTNNLFSYPDHYCQAPTDDVLAPDEYGNIHPSWPLTFRYICFDEAATRPFVNAVNCPEPPLVLETFGTGLNFVEHCPVQIHKPWVPGPVEDKLVTLSIEKSLQNSAIELYGLTINGGETEDLLQILADAHAYESDFLRNMLLQRYPLSNEVMQSAIERASSFDPWHLTQVLIANARLDLNIMTFLEESEVLSPFFMEFIYQANATGDNSLKEILKQEISHRSYVRSVTERDIMRSYLYESDSIDYSGWNQFVSNQNEEYYKLYRLFDNLNSSELIQAQAWRDSLKYVHPDHLDWIDLVISIATSDTITQQNIDDVWDIYSYNDVIMGDALAWLIGNQLTNEIPLPPLQSGNPRSLSTRKPIKQLQHLTFLQAWPNPATDRVMLTYPNEADGMGIIQIFNQQGVMVHQVAAQGRGIAEINTTQWSPGIYIAWLKVEGKVFDEVKISVVK